ncbi:MAG: IS630 family transposase, partial [Pseudomonadota bacterium]
PPRKLEGERAFILARIAEHPSITTRGLAAELSSRGIQVSHMAVLTAGARGSGAHKRSHLANHRPTP